MANEPEMDFATAADHAASYESRMVKPFAELGRVLRAARKAQSELAGMVKARDEAEATRDKYRAEYERDRTALTTELANRKRSSEAEHAALNEGVRTAQREASEIQRQLADQTHALQDAHDEFVMKLQRDKDELVITITADLAQIRAQHATAEAEYRAFRKRVGLPD